MALKIYKEQEKQFIVRDKNLKYLSNIVQDIVDMEENQFNAKMHEKCKAQIEDTRRKYELKLLTQETELRKEMWIKIDELNKKREELHKERLDHAKKASSQCKVEEVERLKLEVKGLNQEVKGLKQEVKGLKQEVKEQKQVEERLNQDLAKCNEKLNIRSFEISLVKSERQLLQEENAKLKRQLRKREKAAETAASPAAKKRRLSKEPFDQKEQKAQQIQAGRQGPNIQKSQPQTPKQHDQQQQKPQIIINPAPNMGQQLHYTTRLPQLLIPTMQATKQASQQRYSTQIGSTSIRVVPTIRLAESSTLTPVPLGQQNKFVEQKQRTGDPNGLKKSINAASLTKATTGKDEPSPSSSKSDDSKKHVRLANGQIISMNKKTSASDVTNAGGRP